MSIRLSAVTAFLLIAVANAAWAASAVPTWLVDKATSKLSFQGAIEDTPFTGHFGKWDAQIAFDPKQLAASKVSVTIDTGSAAAGDKDLDSGMPTDEWFSTAMFPKATFVTKSFKDLGNGHYEANGDLAIRGVAKPVVLPFTLTITGDKAAMRGEVTVKRNMFGLGTKSYADESEVAFPVKIIVALDAHRAP